MGLGVEDPKAALETLIAKSTATETELGQLKRSLDEMRTERDSLLEDMKDFEVFRPLLGQKVVSQQIWLRDKALVQALKGQLLKWYGPSGDLVSQDGGVAKTARHLLDLVVEECVRYSILVVPHIVKMRLDGPRPVKGDSGGDTEA